MSVHSDTEVVTEVEGHNNDTVQGYCTKKK